jgi:acetoin utilization deacetylase AcuC-like enzyme
MTLRYYSHEDCLLHEMQDGHPERPDRLRAVTQYLRASGLLNDLDTRHAPEIDPARLPGVHHNHYLQALNSMRPEEGLVAVDADTTMCPKSLYAARLAAGAVVAATSDVLSGDATRAFCAVRPPGHHAEADASMGFCFYNSIALGARRALEDDHIDRVAILDFDVHHGNGTVDIFKDSPEVLVCSSFQHPYYPHRYADIQRPNIVNSPLAAGSGSMEFRQAIEQDWLPALADHQPQLIFVSAGFDAHRDDPLAQLNLTEADFAWITRLISAAADSYANGRIVSALEGGYDLNALARSVHTHLEALQV